LAIIGILMGLESAEFVHLKGQTNASAGNLSLQLDKLKEAKYIKVTKSFKNNYPVTICSVTKNGIKAFEKYVSDLKAYIEIEKVENLVRNRKK
jgi:polysaccharide deacetylase 2 family uncharacterized protein YibQ